MLLRAIGLGAYVAVSFVLSGCGGETLPTAPVSCLIMLDGKPLSQGTVVFTPAQGRQARGEIQPDGTAVLGTYAKADGAVLGEHQISVAVTVPDESRKSASPVAPVKWLIPSRYGSPATSGLAFRVSKPEGHQVRIELATKGKARITEGATPQR